MNKKFTSRILSMLGSADAHLDDADKRFCGTGI